MKGFSERSNLNSVAYLVDPTAFSVKQYLALKLSVNSELVWKRQMNTLAAAFRLIKDEFLKEMRLVASSSSSCLIFVSIYPIY